MMGRKREADIIELSDDAIGLATITLTKNNSICIYLDAKIIDELDSRVVFNRHALTLRSATIDENGNGLNRSQSGGTVTVKVINPEDIIGKYEVVKEGKVLKLYDLQ